MQKRLGFSKILNHPDKENIIKMLTSGGSIRETAKYLKKKYKSKPHLAISTVTLQKFRKDYLQLDGKVLKDIQEHTIDENREEIEEGKVKKIQETNAYKKKINEIADTHLDVAKKILQLDAVIENRMEYWYNAIAANESNPSVADKEMRQWIDRQMGLMAQYKKFIEGMADKTIDHNINITVFNDQVSVIREVIVGILAELDYEKSVHFMDRLGTELSKLEYSGKGDDSSVDTNVLDALSVQTLDDANEF